MSNLQDFVVSRLMAHKAIYSQMKDKEGIKALPNGKVSIELNGLNKQRQIENSVRRSKFFNDVEFIVKMDNTKVAVLSIAPKHLKAYMVRCKRKDSDCF